MQTLLTRSTRAGPWLRCLGPAGASASSSAQPKVMKANLQAYAEGPTTLVQQDSFKFIVDEPPKLGGRGMGPNPLTYFLGSLTACTQYTLGMIVKEKKLPDIKAALWSAEGKYDLRGVQGTGDTDARFREINVVGTLDTDASQQDLETLAEQVEKRCIVASTCAASGMDLNLTLKKGEVDHNCQPACELHDLEASKNTTGTVKGNPGSEGDAPQFDGTRGHGAPSSRGLHTSAWRGRDGEDVARENLQADKTPQLQKGTSDQGAPETAGGAYGSRDSPRAQAAPPTEGKSDEELVKEQTAGAAVPPAKDGNGDGGGAPESLDFADKAREAVHEGGSQLGQQPSGAE